MALAWYPPRTRPLAPAAREHAVQVLLGRRDTLRRGAADEPRESAEPRLRQRHARVRRLRQERVAGAQRQPARGQRERQAERVVRVAALGRRPLPHLQSLLGDGSAAEAEHPDRPGEHGHEREQDGAQTERRREQGQQARDEQPRGADREQRAAAFSLRDQHTGHREQGEPGQEQHHAHRAAREVPAGQQRQAERQRGERELQPGRPVERGQHKFRAKHRDRHHRRQADHQRPDGARSPAVRLPPGNATATRRRITRADSLSRLGPAPA